MTEHLYSVLDELVPRFDDEPGDWSRVIADARTAEPVATSVRPGDMTPENRPRSRSRWLTRRRMVAVIAIAVVAIATPLIAAASQDWWFFRFVGTVPEPVTDVKVVKTGEWGGKPWQLVAYLSATSGICYGLTPTDATATGEGGSSLACAPVEGVPRRESTKQSAPLAITFLAASSLGAPAFVLGPVIDTADEVEIHLAGGEVVRTPTFDAPDELGSIRFYATQLPDLDLRKLVGIGHDGQVVACLVVPTTRADTPLSTCP
jgi:hypothetical protein